ncbi:M28 family metallopeptidase [Frateuria aurantia]
MLRRRLTWALALALGLPAGMAMAAADVADSGAQAIKAASFNEQIKTLSSDAFDGRGPGTAAEKLTTDYLIAQFKRMGLQPGVNGQWLQAVPYVSVKMADPAKSVLAVQGANGSTRFSFGDQWVINSINASPKVDIRHSQLVFVGYGVNAPELGWNDYAGLDVKGKTVVILVNDPGWGDQDPNLFRGKALTYYGRWTYKYEEAAREGAAAALIVHDTAAAGYPWSVVHSSWTGTQYNLPPSVDPAPRLAAAGWLSADAAAKLFADSGVDFAKLHAAADHPGFKPVTLNAHVDIKFDNVIGHGVTHNVIAKLTGTTRPDEAIVYTAHWDHLGNKAGKIYHGAVDNGTGVAGLLQIADAFAHRQPKPQRTIIFASVTMEESGLLGSRYYVTHPVIPLAKTVADINMDAIPMIGRTHDITLIGGGQSQMDDLIAAVAKKQGRYVSQDPTPEQGMFFRSDQLNFAKLGVPVLYAEGGTDLLKGGKTAGEAARADYVAHRYHQPSDVYDPNWDARGAIEDLQALYEVGSGLADSPDFPQWKPGSDFKRPATP